MGLETCYKTPVNWKDLLNNKERQCDDAKMDSELLETISTAVLQVDESQKSVLDTKEAINTVVENIRLEMTNELEAENGKSLNCNSINTNTSKLNEYDFHSVWKNFIDLPKRKSCAKETFTSFLSSAD